MLNTSAGAGRLEATPEVGGCRYGSAQPVAGPGQERLPVGRLRCVAAPSAAHRPVGVPLADGRAGGRADIGLRGRDASRATRAAGCQVGRVARPVMRKSVACLAAAVPAVRRSLSLAMMRPVQPAAPGCIAVPAGATMMRATQRNQLHHRCIRSRRTVKSQVTAAARRPGRPRAPQGRTLRRRQRVFTRTAE